MQAKELMTLTVGYISPDTKIGNAAQKMKQLDVGVLPICENDRLVGALTNRDIVLRVIANGKNARGHDE
jgi:CBS domain-containing protein